MQIKAYIYEILALNGKSNSSLINHFAEADRLRQLQIRQKFDVCFQTKIPVFSN